MANEAEAGYGAYPTHAYHPAPLSFSISHVPPGYPSRELGVYPELSHPYAYHALPSHCPLPPTLGGKGEAQKNARGAELENLNTENLSQMNAQVPHVEEDVSAKSHPGEQVLQLKLSDHTAMPDHPSDRNPDEKQSVRPNNALPSAADYSHEHGPYATQPAYFPPPPPSYGPPDTWRVPYPLYHPYYHTNNAYHNPPQYSCGIRTLYPPSARPKKRQLPSLSLEKNSSNVANEERHLDLDHTRKSDKLPSPSIFPTGKNVRRKKKMYSDFVGVTYNKTHAKYQACITHYRKQHYLGRYKLAVDAALAYDESARLLKGASWKVNFSCRQAYEAAKVQELSTFGKMGVASVDVVSSLEAVAIKVEEIASNVGKSGAPRMTANRRYYDAKPRTSDTSYAGLSSSQCVGHEGDIEEKCPVAKQWNSHSRKIELPLKMTTPTAKAKVTPSPTLLTSSPSDVDAVRDATHEHARADTPLPSSPNPLRHALGIEPRTPDSVIRPKNLTYHGGRRCASPHPASPLAASQGSAPSPPLPPRPKAWGADAPTATLIASKRSLKAPPIQNGTLAAASALMTLFEAEKAT